MIASVQREEPTPEASETRDSRASVEPLERVYVWDAVVRLTHWLIALSIVVLSVTGIHLGHPFIGPSDVPGRMVTANVRVIHLYAAIVFSLAVLVRLAWMFTGPPQARWHQFLPVTSTRMRDLVRTLSFYLFLRRSPPGGLGHNPLAGVAYLLVYGLCLVMIATGLGLHAPDAGVSYMRQLGFLLALFGGAQTARLVHHVVMWLLIGFFAHHIWSTILMSIFERAGLVDSMVSGYKFILRDEAHRDR